MNVTTVTVSVNYSVPSGEFRVILVHFLLLRLYEGGSDVFKRKGGLLYVDMMVISFSLLPCCSFYHQLMMSQRVRSVDRVCYLLSKDNHLTRVSKKGRGFFYETANSWSLTGPGGVWPLRLSHVLPLCLVPVSRLCSRVCVYTVPVATLLMTCNILVISIQSNIVIHRAHYFLSHGCKIITDMFCREHLNWACCLLAPQGNIVVI